MEFSPSNAVPGEENTLRLSAQPGSLCGLGAVDQSVGIMEPGKRLDADKVTELTEVNYSGTSIPTVLVVLGIQPGLQQTWSGSVHWSFGELLSNVMGLILWLEAHFLLTLSNWKAPPC